MWMVVVMVLVVRGVIGIFSYFVRKRDYHITNSTTNDDVCGVLFCFS